MHSTRASLKLKVKVKVKVLEIGEEPSPGYILYPYFLSAPVIGYGYGEQKPHKTLMDVLRGNEARLLGSSSNATR